MLTPLTSLPTSGQTEREKIRRLPRPEPEPGPRDQADVSRRSQLLARLHDKRQGPEWGQFLDDLFTPKGYAGDPGRNLTETTTPLLASFDAIAGEDEVMTIEDLQRAAEDQSLPEEVRLAAQHTLADPNAWKAMENADGQRDGVAADDLVEVLWNEHQAPDDLPPVDEVAGALDAYCAEQGLDFLSVEDLERMARDPDCPVGDEAAAVLANPNYFNILAAGGMFPELIDGNDLTDVHYSTIPQEGAQWGLFEQLSLVQALDGDKEGQWDDLVSEFSQTDRGNCASVAVIKAAMDTYGNKVFDQVRPLDDGAYQVTLRDGSQVVVTREELEAAATATHFDVEDPGADAYATLSYAVIAKRYQQESGMTYAESLVEMANGAYPEEIAGYLGLGDLLEHVPVGELEGQDAGVIWGDGHARYVSGFHADSWGRPEDFDDISDPNHVAFVFRKEPTTLERMLEMVA